MGNIIYAKWLRKRMGGGRLKVLARIPKKQIPQGIPSWSYLRTRRHTMEAAEVLFVLVCVVILIISLSQV